MSWHPELTPMTSSFIILIAPQMAHLSSLAEMINARRDGKENKRATIKGRTSGSRFFATTSGLVWVSNKRKSMFNTWMSARALQIVFAIPMNEKLTFSRSYSGSSCAINFYKELMIHSLVHFSMWSPFHFIRCKSSPVLCLCWWRTSSRRSYQTSSVSCLMDGLYSKIYYVAILATQTINRRVL